MITCKETFVNNKEVYFEKLSEDGNKLSYFSNRKDGARVIFDKNTGLYWEIKSENEKDINYYNNKYNFEDAQIVYTKQLNNENYGGYHDWRMPNKDELRSILDYGRREIALDLDIFENCVADDYWTKNTYGMQPYFAWVIYFGFGSGIAKSKKTKRYVLACRGGKERLFGEPDESRFTNNGDGTVTDIATGLMWQQGENPRMDFYSAVEYSKNMTLGGFTDWRIPNIKELNTILNLSFENNWWYFKNIFTAEGLAPPLLHYFSSSTFKNKYAWVTNFCFGYDGYYGEKSATLLFRACRDTQVENDLEVEKVEEFKLPHTGETKIFDVEGSPSESLEYQGLDATRITNKMEYELMFNACAARDKNTGLLWEIKSDENNVGYTWEEAMDYVALLNKNNYCGFADWRIPQREELRTLVNYDGNVPAINTEVFRDTKVEFYWANEEHKIDNSMAWGIYFGYGCAIGYPKDTKACVRAVRGNLSIYNAFVEERFIDNKDGTVTDKKLALMWMQEETPLLTLKEALVYCKDLRLVGHDDWVLSNMKELGSLINVKDGQNWYYDELFPNTNTKPQGFYLSSTTFDATFAWGCNFQFGFDGYYADRKNGKYPFRPVRML